MLSFNGEFRRKPIINIRGASKVTKKADLVEQAQKERQKRENHRLESKSATVIQNGIRSYLARRAMHKHWRRQFDQYRAAQNFQPAWSRLSLFFQIQSDRERLLWLCQCCVKDRDQIARRVSTGEPDECYRVARLCQLCLQLILRASPEENVNPALRILEIFTATATYPAGSDLAVAQIFRYLIRRDYFECLRSLCDARIPPMIEATSKAPTPLAEIILDLIARPLRLLSQSEQSLRSEIVRRLGRSFFQTEFSEQVRNFILPALSETQFPFLEWISALNREDEALSNIWLLYSFLSLGHLKLEEYAQIEVIQYLTVLSHLTEAISRASNFSKIQIDDDPDDSDDEPEASESVSGTSSMTYQERECLQTSLSLLNTSETVSNLITATERCAKDPLALKLLAKICHNLLLADKVAIHKFRLLNTLAFRSALIHRLWNLILDAKQPSSIGKPIPLLTVISRGIRINRMERNAIAPLLAVFSSLFGYLLVTINDTEFYGDAGTNATPGQRNQSIWMPFTLQELSPMSLSLRDVTLGLVELAFPESRPTVREDYQIAVRAVREARNMDIPSSTRPKEIADEETQIWSHLFKKTVVLVRQLYTRDTRRQFCPDDHWICNHISLPLDRPHDISLRRSRLRQYRPFQGLRVFTREELEEEGPPLSAKEVRLATILREMPYAVSFPQRILVFSNLISRDKQEHQGDRINFLQGPIIRVLIRRNYIYEDAFEKLSPKNEPNLQLKMQVQLMNAVGLDEAGVDGGGLFREFMTEFLKTAFDPNRGFFRLTRDQQLYPNPTVNQIEPDFIPHYFFIGRMLGKALYENHLVELPLASFFLSKLLGQHSVNVDIDHLSSLDPELYKNLLYLKTYEGDVVDLGLDFTMVSEEVGTTRVHELLPGGSDIPVTNENRIEYIHIVADHKLNRQIRAQCNAFRQGLSDVINLDWLRMFSYRELQTLISGAEHEINVDDLEQCTKYGNGFDEDHPTIKTFWKVVRELSEDQKRSLLKFVTSCSRPPLLGFKELEPPFAIQNVGDESERLPTASTCMNLLKLPEFKDERTLKTKLLYAIESGAGFELS
eukprot:maker-scaffold363_size195477-snap-gene-0.52 protein:Tk06661 transcript:maker-scaffold363_size195477-snap-gene-0.52-mRNA-1 annotation:"ubiquitin-protein ligase e3c"